METIIGELVVVVVFFLIGELVAFLSVAVDSVYSVTIMI